MTQIDTLAKFGPTFQTKAIAVMLTDKTFLDQAQDIIDDKHFELDAHSWIVGRILWYFGEYRDIPSMEVFKKEVDKIHGNDVLKTSVIQSLKEVYKNTTASDISYIKDEFLTFCKNQALKNAILKAADKLQRGDYDGIKSIVDKAMTAGQERNFGHNWKEDVEKRAVHLARDTVATGWEVIDQIMDGGLAAGELGVIVAPPGIGKSWGLAHIGKAALQNGRKIVHYTFELNENYLGLRYDTLFTGIEPNKIKDNVEQVRKAIESITGEVIIKNYPTRTVSTTALRAHLDRLESTGYIPEVVIVDYGDLMRSTDKSNARWEELGIVYEDLRGLAGELGVPIWTASQSQRASLNDDIIEAGRIAESFNKIMTADFVMSISRKLADKVANTARIHIMKNRFGPDGLTFPALADFVSGKFEIYDENSAEGVRIKRQMSDGDNILKNLLHKKMIEFSVEEDDNDLG